MILVLVVKELVANTDAARSKLDKPPLHTRRETLEGRQVDTPMNGARDRRWNGDIVVGLPIVKKRRARNCNMQCSLVKPRTLGTINPKCPWLKHKSGVVIG